MAYDEQLAERIRRKIGRKKGLIEKKMFGGLAFLLNGNMCCGVHGKELIVRLEPEKTDAALSKPNTFIFHLSGRPMKAWILVKPAGLKDEKTLSSWIRVGLDYASSLPKK